MNLILEKFVSPRGEVVWKKNFHLGQDLNWPSVWISNWKNGLLDPEDLT